MGSPLRDEYGNLLPRAENPELARPAFGLPTTAALAALLVLTALAYLIAPWLVRRALQRSSRSGPSSVALLQAGRALDMLYPPNMELPWRLRPGPLGEDRLSALRREYDLGMVACAAATFSASAWLVTALLATYAHLTEFWWSTLQVLTGLTVAFLGFLACYNLQPLPRHDRPSWLRRAIVALPVLATLVLFGLATPSPSLTGELSTFNGLRFLTMSSLVSPTAPCCVSRRR